MFIILITPAPSQKPLPPGEICGSNAKFFPAGH